MNSSIKTVALLGTALAVSACSTDQTLDQGFDNKPLAALKADVWVAPSSCKYWIVDDGIEGYLTPILNRDGTPDCA